MTTITQTAQPATAPLAAAPYAPAVTGAENATNAAIGDLDFSQFYEQSREMRSRLVFREVVGTL